jgi:hypothetical protein
MKNVRIYLLTTAAAALIAAPMMAMELTADAMLGAAPEDMTTVKMAEDSAFINNEVMTKDQKVIGLVKGVEIGADGTQRIFIELASDIAAKSSVKTFTVSVPSDTTADGALTLAWNEDELFRALSSNLEASGG